MEYVQNTEYKHDPSRKAICGKLNMIKIWEICFLVTLSFAPFSFLVMQFLGSNF